MTLKVICKISLIAYYLIPIESKIEAQTLATNNWGANHDVLAITEDANYFYIGGSFVQVGGRKLKNISIVTAAEDLGSTSLPEANGIVNAVVPDGLGGWFIGGDFTQVGGIERNRLAHILSDGTLDPNWNPNANNVVYALAISGSNIFIGGAFTNVSGSTRNRLASITSSGILNTWNPNVSNGTVYCIEISGSNLYIGGTFTTIGGAARNRIASVTTSGSLNSWNPNANNAVNSIMISGSNIFLGGEFTTIGGTPRNRIASVTTSGTLNTWNPNANGPIKSIKLSGTDLYIGGTFTTIGGATRNRIAKVNSSGSASISEWNPNMPNTTSESIDAIEIIDNNVFVAGKFNMIGGLIRNNLAKLNNTTGAADADWNPEPNGYLKCLGISYSDIFIGGSFDAINAVARHRLARFSKTNFNLDESWDPAPNAIVRTLAISGEQLYVGGDFTTISNLSRNRIVRFNTTTSQIDPSWNPDANNSITTIAFEGSDMYIGGAFTTIGGTTRNRLAKVNNTTGALNTNWNPNANGNVNAIAIVGSEIYIGGAFTTIGVTTRNRLAKVNNTTGALNTSWNPNADNQVDAIAIAGNDILIGGFFNNVGVLARKGIAKLNNSTGTAYASWNLNSNSNIHSIAISNNDLYVAGGFTSIAGANITRAAKINLISTEVFATWNFTINNTVNVIYLSTSNKIYLGGKFSIIDNESNKYFAVITPPASIPNAPFSLTATPSNQNISISFTPGENGGSEITNYEYSLNNGLNWTAFDPPINTPPVNISGLTNGVNYSIQLRAINAVGPSTASTIVSATPATIPSAPTRLHVVSGDRKLTISFTLDSDGGAAITNYQYSIDGSSEWTSCSPSKTESPVVISELENATSYNIALRAVNTMGPGIASNPITGMPGRPSTPTNLTVTNGNSQVTLNFTPGLDGGSPIINYEYTLNGEGWVACNPSVIDPPIIITGLTNGTNYTVAIRAVNAIVRDGEPSVSINAQPNIPLPLTWLDFSGVSVNNAFELYWSTSSEHNTKDFQIEFSTNIIDWQIIGTITAAGSSNNERKYRFLHTGPFTKKIKHYYRIKQRDLDENFSYSKTLALSNRETNNEVIIFPNPTSDFLTIRVSEAQEALLLNPIGMHIWSGKLKAGINLLPVAHLNKNLYLLRIGDKTYRIFIK